MLKQLFAYIALCLVVSSCATLGERLELESAYPMNKMHVPLFSKAKQTELEASFTGSIELAGGYSINEFIAAVGSIRIMDPISSDSNFHQNRFFEIGAGYFFENQAPFRVEAFMRFGIGFMQVVDQYYSSIGSFSYNFNKYSLQLNIGLEWKKFAVATSYRGGYMHLTDVSRTIKSTPGDSVTTNSFVNSEGSSFFDLGVTVRYMPIPEAGIELQIVPGGMSDAIGFSDPGHAGSEFHLIGALSLVVKF